MDTSAQRILAQLRSRIPAHRISQMKDEKVTTADLEEARSILRKGRVKRVKSSTGRTVRLVPRWVDGRTRHDKREALRTGDPEGLLPKGGPVSLQFVPDNGEPGGLTVVFLPMEVGSDYRNGFKFGVSFCSPEDTYTIAKGYDVALEKAKKCRPVMLDLVKIAQRGGLGELVSVLLMSVTRPRWISNLATTTFKTRNLNSYNSLVTSNIFLFSGVRMNRILGVSDEEEEGAE